MRVLITGGTGFIGSRLAEALLQDGHDVRVSGRSQLCHQSLLDLGARYFRGDLADEEFAEKVSKNIEVIVHCAGMAGTWGPYADYHRANVLATKHLMDGAKANGVRRVVNISSPSVYFDFKDQFDLKESEIPRKFSNAYAKTKYEAELLVHSYHCEDLQTVSLRPRSVIGRGDQNILPRLLRLQQTGNLMQIGPGDNVVDMTSVGNLIDAVSLCLAAPPDAMGETYNITDGSPVRFWSFVENVLTAAGLPANRKHFPYAPVMFLAKLNEWASRMARRKSEPALLPISVGVLSFSMTLDISKAREKLRYSPKHSTADGIREFFERSPASD